ncbi:MAG: DUF2169 domain-containing protein [Luteitalea sp.]|nr:DUF2169 domain-containing protein [Luteitalea sp.]
MQLVNTTPVHATLSVSAIDGKAFRAGLITAKATFQILDGRALLDSQTPLPAFRADQETELGLLPRDDLRWRGSRFEVIVLGTAHAPPGKVISAATVSLSIATEERSLAVFGDRVWEEDVAGAPRISAPEAFIRMPLTWNRTFGGTTEVLVDVDSYVDLAEPRNPVGRGFDPGPAAEELRKAWRTPPGFPQYDRLRRLPNLEDPGCLIQRPEDTPNPLCWAALQVGSPLHAPPSTARDPNVAWDELPPEPENMFRAHPTWVIARPPAEAPVRLEGMMADGSVFSFQWPALRVFADYVAGRHTGTRELMAFRLVLLPEEQRFYLVYQHPFTVIPRAGEERAMRLRLESFQ